MIKPLFICNVKNPSEHCKEQCFHGEPHIKSRLSDANCANLDELCGLSDSKRKVRIKCRKLTKRELR